MGIKSLSFKPNLVGSVPTKSIYFGIFFGKLVKIKNRYATRPSQNATCNNNKSKTGKAHKIRDIEGVNCAKIAPENLKQKNLFFAKRLLYGGLGGTRTPDQTVMSGQL